MYLQNSIYKMLFRRMIQFFNISANKIVLGRWGYHWEVNKNLQKYYD